MDIDSIGDRFYCSRINRTTTPAGCSRRQLSMGCLCHVSFTKEIKKKATPSPAQKKKAARDRARQCFELYYVQQKSVKEIRDILEITDITLRTLYNIIIRESKKRKHAYPRRLSGPVVNLRPIQEVADLIKNGKSIKEISALIGRKKNHIYYIRRKAVKHGLLDKKGE